MADPLKVYIGFDWRDETAFRVAEASLRAHASIPVRVERICDYDLRQRGVYWRTHRVERDGQMVDDRDGRPFSTMFSFARFAVPLIEDTNDWVLFTDPDVLWRADVAELLALADPTKAVMCVQHDHRPDEPVKMDGVRQEPYRRKNWSSVMLMRPRRCAGLTPYVLNNFPGSALHAMTWADEAGIGALPERWNWLVNISPTTDAPEDTDPALVHFTLGTPDFPGREKDPFADEWRRHAAAL